MPEPVMIVAVRGTEGVARWIGHIVPRIVKKAADDENKATAYRARDVLKTYEAPPTETYQRTGTMSRQTAAGRVPGTETDWYVRMNAGGRAPYSVYVRGDAYGHGQAWMHIGRWRTFRSIVDEAERGRAQRIAQRIWRAVRAHLGR